MLEMRGGVLMIYCVEDDASIRELVLYTLRASGFEARGFAESGAFWEAMCEHVPDLVLLDIMLPGEDGLEILKKLRSSPLTEQLPVILATARGSEYDKVVGLDTGADDYLAEPFGMMEMVSRIRAVLRRSARQPSGVLSCGGVTLDEGRHAVTVNDRPVSLILGIAFDCFGKHRQVFSAPALLARVGRRLRRGDAHGGRARRHTAYKARRMRRPH